jgi:flagellar basal-body rod protein FlgB
MGNLVMGNLVNRDFEPTLAKAGDTVNVPVPPSLIANNIANADTPGFKAMDLDFRQILSQAAAEQDMKLPGQAGGLRQTHAGHMDTLNADGNDLLIDPLQPQYRIPSQPALDGNSVDTQMEKAAFAENQLRYQASVQFLDDRVSGLKRAFRGN